MLSEIRVRNPNRAELLPLNLPLLGLNRFRVVFIDGLNPVQAEFSSSPYANLPGEYLQSSRVGARNIVLTLELRPSYADGEDAESLRDILSDYLTPQSTVDLELITDKATRHISGTVESFESPLFVKSPQVQISILCHDPYFRPPSPTTIDTNVYNGDPLVVNNPGKIPVGFRLRFFAGIDGDEFLLRMGSSGGDTMQIVGPFLTNDGITIDTRPKMKNATFTYSGASLLPRLVKGSKWAMLRPGDNQVYMEVITSSLGYYNQVVIDFEERYSGL